MFGGGQWHNRRVLYVTFSFVGEFRGVPKNVFRSVGQHVYNNRGQEMCGSMYQHGYFKVNRQDRSNH